MLTAELLADSVVDDVGIIARVRLEGTIQVGGLEGEHLASRHSKDGEERGLGALRDHLRVRDQGARLL